MIKSEQYPVPSRLVDHVDTLLEQYVSDDAIQRIYKNVREQSNDQTNHLEHTLPLSTIYKH